jgi:ketosteroid isomerase-like protein
MRLTYFLPLKKMPTKLAHFTSIFLIFAKQALLKPKRMKSLFLAISLLFSLHAFAQDEKEITKSILDQADKWNKGDLTGFMSYYWVSDSLLFVGKNGPTYGWNTVKANYEKNYGKDQQDLGKLHFEILQTQKLGKNNYFMLGKWLVKKEGNADKFGFFTLIWKKIKGKWLIVADHTS